MDELKLLHVLENDPRISITDLADILNETEEVVVRTKRRLEDEKIICGYHTVINWDKTNRDHCMAIIEVGAQPERESGYDNVAAEISKYPEVSSLYLMSGKSEFMVVIQGKTMREVADFVGQKLAPIEGVKHTITCFVLKQYKVEGVVVTEDEEPVKRLIVTP
ncbi:Lrp/AsnC family transcriptional regulator [Anaerorhabdus furcosa]|uniref:DNA-binding transcriptional regulator, Lrp family n=1 Tax=Anaerorhabdus furcosa TaxID=118967 RepID=A0A1T4K6D6_9FIRM|nr:Lrp/AsnC family transcriptional regulator [Anaerorhabdus furcosa]SJZ37893.1 DNA-binding transcriptional regulator, Lrp family [Anaerorhabdus furcosa]